MESEEKIRVFLSDFDFQVNQVGGIFKTLERRESAFGKQPVSSEMVESTGYWLHNLYCAFEDLFKLVAGFWENSISDNGGFHINLLKRMRTEVKGIRPPLISQETFTHLSELRGFRHVFRHAYAYGLDDERVAFLLKRVTKWKEVVFNDLSRFRKTISMSVPQ
ncbi:MAG: hypothetical protein JEZ11_11710 [Desulfobacterales bacterium]|nr:hypothetical protein [Desulfobacterales bacterium]